MMKHIFIFLMKTLWVIESSRIFIIWWSFFYEILQEYDLLPYWGEAFAEDKRFEFNRKPLTNFSYERQLKNSAFVKSLVKNIGGGLPFDSWGDESYSIAENVVYCSNEYSESDFNDIWAYVKMLMKYNMLWNHRRCVRKKAEDKGVKYSSYRYYVINIW